MRAFFYDTWAFVALSNARDPAHAVSRRADEALERGRYVASTSDYVLDETVTTLHAAAGARVALAFADLVSARVEARDLLLFDITARRRHEALRLFRKLAPQTPRLSFTDCTTFAVMGEAGIRLAFTADRHFHRAGRGIRPLVERRGSELALILPGSAE